MNENVLYHHTEQPGSTDVNTDMTTTCARTEHTLKATTCARTEHTLKATQHVCLCTYSTITSVVVDSVSCDNQHTTGITSPTNFLKINKNKKITIIIKFRTPLFSASTCNQIQFLTRYHQYSNISAMYHLQILNNNNILGNRE